MEQIEQNDRVLAYKMATTVTHASLKKIGGGEGQEGALNMSHQFTHHPVMNASEQASYTFDETFD